MFLAVVAFAAVIANSNGAPGAVPTVCKGTVCTPYRGAARRLPRAATDRAGSEVRCSSAYVVDGDTLRCGRDRIRLLGIDAPELGRCPRWRDCAPGDGQTSKRSLVEAVGYGPVSYQPVTYDRYGRIVAVVSAGNVNLSCWQLEHGQAIYKPNWDTGRLVARECR